MSLGDLLTEQLNPVSERIDAVSTEEMLRMINAEDSKVAAAVALEIPKIAAAVEAIADAMRRGGRLFYIGAGTSGRLGVLDAAECPPTFNVPAQLVQGVIAGGEAALARATEASEDDAGSGERDLLERGFRRGDVVVGIAASGRTPYVIGAVKAARSAGGRTIGISCTPLSELTRSVEIAIEALVGPEVIAGSTRMKAGTATKLVLNMLSTGVMIRLGYVYRNLMVNVQPRNVKLAARAARIVAAASGIDEDAAARRLEESGGSVRTAIAMAKLGISRAEAERRLEAAGGCLAPVLEESS
jgi:N-acetylmuramic acid 6-phosphate etherase